MGFKTQTIGFKFIILLLETQSSENIHFSFIREIMVMVDKLNHPITLSTDLMY